MPTSTERLYQVTYIPTDGRAEWDVDTCWTPAVVSNGVITSGDSYRIVDVCVNHEKRGGAVGEHGVYV